MSGRQFTVVIVITFIVGMVWLVSDIIFNTKASIVVSEKLQTLLEPIDPNFNPRVLETIDKEVTEVDFFSVENQLETSAEEEPLESTASAETIPGL